MHRNNLFFKTTPDPIQFKTEAANDCILPEEIILFILNQDPVAAQKALFISQQFRRIGRDAENQHLRQDFESYFLKKPTEDKSLTTLSTKHIAHQLRSIINACRSLEKNNFTRAEKIEKLKNLFLMFLELMQIATEKNLMTFNMLKETLTGGAVSFTPQPFSNQDVAAIKKDLNSPSFSLDRIVYCIKDSFEKKQTELSQLNNDSNRLFKLFNTSKETLWQLFTATYAMPEDEAQPNPSVKLG